MLLTRKQGQWDQATFEKLLVEWLIACDQPFQEVERPEFRCLLEYVHHRGETLHIPSRRTVERRLRDLGKSLEDELKQFFAVCSTSHSSQTQFSMLTIRRN